MNASRWRMCPSSRIPNRGLRPSSCIFRSVSIVSPCVLTYMWSGLMKRFASRSYLPRSMAPVSTSMNGSATSGSSANATTWANRFKPNSVPDCGGHVG